MSDAPTAEAWRLAHALRPLLWHIARRHAALASGSVELEDLVQVGTIEAARSLPAYDASKGRLDSHMARRAEAGMVRHARRFCGPVTVKGQAWAYAVGLEDWTRGASVDPWPAVERRDALRAVLRPDSVDDELLLGWAHGWQDAEQGARHGVSGERVRQRRARALDRLKRRMGA